MDRRTAGALIGILMAVCLGLVLSVMYPFSTSEPHAMNPPDERFTVGDSEAYSTTGSIAVEGETELALEGVVTSEGAWYQKVIEKNVVSEEYRPPTNRTVYQRLTVTGRDRAGRLREQITEDEDRALLGENQKGNRVTFLVEENATDATEPVSGTASVFINSLSVVGYESDRRGPSSVSLYEPRSGWYEGRETYRITEASGNVRANAETHVVKSANVSWHVTTPAGSYAEYALVRSTTDDPAARRITFEFDPDEDALERPTWVDRTVRGS
jgi:hypothetical protein